MKKTKILFLAMLVWAFALPALAQPETGVYLAASVGKAKHKGYCFGDTIPGVFECDNNAQTWGVDLGYQFTKYFATEVGYHDLGGADDLIFGTFKENTSAKAWEVVGVGSLPILRFSVYVKAGGYYAKSKYWTNFDAPEGYERNVGWTAGAGVRYDLWRHLAVRAEYQRYNNVGGPDVFSSNNDVDVNRFSIVLKF